MNSSDALGEAADHVASACFEARGAGFMEDLRALASERGLRVSVTGEGATLSAEDSLRLLEWFADAMGYDLVKRPPQVRQYGPECYAILEQGLYHTGLKVWSSRCYAGHDVGNDFAIGTAKDLHTLLDDGLLDVKSSNPARYVTNAVGIHALRCYERPQCSTTQRNASP
jgi:hypothetical protein